MPIKTAALEIMF